MSFQFISAVFQQGRQTDDLHRSLVPHDAWLDGFLPGGGACRRCCDQPTQVPRAELRTLGGRKSWDSHLHPLTPTSRV